MGLYLRQCQEYSEVCVIKIYSSTIGLEIALKRFAEGD